MDSSHEIKVYIEYENTAKFVIQTNVKYSCLKVWLDTKTLCWREIKTPALPEVQFRHLSPAMSALSPALGEPGIQMTGALHQPYIYT